MIDFLIIILIFVAFILYQMIPMHPEVKETISLVLASGLTFYVAYNVNDVGLSKLFNYLGLIMIILIPVIIIIRYIEKLIPDSPNKQE